MRSIREVLRQFLMGPRYLRYWQSLRTAELKRLGYEPPAKRAKGARNA